VSRGPAVGLFVLLFASYAYFYQAGGWNQNSRFSLVRAITNEHSLRIDPFQASTGDKAYFEGHFYSDKAPGVSLMAAPVVFFARPILRAAGGDPESYGGIAFLSWLATVMTSGFMTALAAVVLYRVCVTLGVSESGALFGAMTYGLASPIWPLATLFLGHAVSAACLVIAFAAAVWIQPRERTTARLHDTYWVVDERQRDIQLGLLVGVGGGWATVCEFPAAVPAAIIAAFAAVQARKLGQPRAAYVIASVVTGAVACAAALMIYQYVCFGSPFHVAYTSEAGFEAMQQGFFGVRTPDAGRLRAVLFGQYRGLLFIAPAFALAPIGFAIAFARAPQARAPMTVAALVAAYYVLLNASYTYWEGGWSYGPRHLSPAIPFLACGLAWLWAQPSRAIRGMLATLTVIGFALAFLAVSTMAQPPAQYQRPIAELLWPAFRDGDLSLNTQRFTDGGSNGGALRAHRIPKAAWNVGMKLGLEAHASLVPLAIIWLACGFWIIAAQSRVHDR